MKLQGFLKAIDHDRVVEAIRRAETGSHGEIRVHASNRIVDDAQAAAAELFEKLGMTATKARNGVLIYVAPRSRRFAILGDIGIHEKCGAGFWQDVAAAMEADFREQRFTEGLVKGIERAGEVLALHFPRAAGDADINELPDTVSED